MLRVGFTLTGVLLIAGCTNSAGKDANHELLDRESVTCSPPARPEIQSWGQAGLSLSCKMVNGSFVAVENGYVHMRGQYEAGREVGMWRWYDKDGNVVKTIDYSKPDQATN